MTDFRWSPRREKAAILLAEDLLSDEQIAAEVGVTRKSLAEWKTDAQFSERVADIIRRRTNVALRYSIAQQDKRIAAIDARWQAMQRLMDARAQEIGPRVPGGDTGLLTRQIKLSNTGMTVDEYVVDTGLLKEMRALEEQAAKELGQWIERKEHTGKDGGPIQVTNARDELTARLAALAERRRAIGDGRGSER